MTALVSDKLGIMLKDEDFDISTSSADYLESPEKARMKALKAKLEKAGIKIPAHQQDDLKSLKLALLKGQVHDKDAKDDHQSKGTEQGTKTREEEIAAAKLSADAKPTTQKLVTQGSEDHKSSEELKKDEVQSEDA